MITLGRTRCQNKRTLYRDRWNSCKVWEVVELVGGYYLRQYVNGSQWGSGLKTSKAFIKSIGVFDFEMITNELQEDI